MSNFNLKSVIKSNTPVKRLGLSRKRKSIIFTKENSYPKSATSAIDQGTSESKMKYFKLESTDCLKNTEALEKEQNIESGTDSQSILEKVKICEGKGNDIKSVTDKIKDLESLYLIWKEGFKNALLYLVNFLKERQGESVDLRKVLSDLRILENVKEHFKNDTDLDFFIYDE